TSAVVRTSPFITERKSSTPPTTNVDLDRSADSVTLSHGPKKARLIITRSDYLVDIIAENITCDGRHDNEDFMWYTVSLIRENTNNI
ncbi:hypothetical protein EG68_12366, partial [Paragonimus skrjabini miyazakii]